MDTNKSTATLPLEGSLLTIAGTTYRIAGIETPETHEAAGRYNIAREMRKNKQAWDLILTKPKGKKWHFSTRFESGNFSAVTAVDFC